MAQLTIGAVAARTGLRASAIRYYEAEGLLPRAPREHGRRVYDSSVFSRLAVIELAKTAGFTLAEIKFVLSAASARPPSTTWQKLTNAKRAEIEGQMRALALKKRVVDGIAKCNCHSLDDCGRAFSAAVAKYLATHRPVNTQSHDAAKPPSPPKADEQREALRAYKSRSDAPARARR